MGAVELVDLSGSSLIHGGGISKFQSPFLCTFLLQQVAVVWTQVLAGDRLSHPPLLGHIWMHLSGTRPNHRTKLAHLG